MNPARDLVYEVYVRQTVEAASPMLTRAEQVSQDGAQPLRPRR